MARKEYEHPSEKKGLVIGVDSFLVPGDLTHRTFLQVWDSSEFNEPCNEGEGEFNNILVDEMNVDVNRVVAVARQHGFNVLPREVFEIFN